MVFEQSLLLFPSQRSPFFPYVRRPLFRRLPACLPVTEKSLHLLLVSPRRRRVIPFVIEDAPLALLRPKEETGNHYRR